MNHVLSKSILLMTSIAVIGLAGCAANTRSENTTIGAVTGAVVGGAAGSLIGAGTGQVVAIGAGAVAGALIGGYIGSSMQSSDSQMAYTTISGPAPQAVHWTNQTTHNQYTVVTGNYITVHGNTHCRRFNSTAVIGGKTRTLHGVACRMPNGTWQTVTP